MKLIERGFIRKKLKKIVGTPDIKVITAPPKRELYEHPANGVRTFSYV